MTGEIEKQIMYNENGDFSFFPQIWLGWRKKATKNLSDSYQFTGWYSDPGPSQI